MCCLLMFTGCSEIGFGDQAMLRPPRATGDQAAMQQIISEEAAGSYTLKYPQNGEYRSAVNIFNSSDGMEYAAALYSTENDSKMHVTIMVHEGEQWRSLGSCSNSGTGVDRIVYQDINSDGIGEFLIGWTGYNPGVNTLSVYSLDSDTVRETPLEEPYTDFVITDLTGDNKDDIVLLSLRNNQAPSSATLMQYSEQDKRPISKYAIELDNEVTAFNSVFSGMIDKTTTGIIIDGENALEQNTTQVIYYDKNVRNLVNPLITETDGGQKKNVTFRKEVITARDINGDGIIEVPVISDMAAPKDVKAGCICSCTSWKQIDTKDGSLTAKMNTIFNYNDGYYFVMPARWGTDVTALSDSEERLLTFYIWSSKTSSLGDKLLEIHRFSRSEWDKMDQTDYIMLHSVNNGGREYIIAGRIFITQAIETLNISKAELERNVKLI